MRFFVTEWSGGQSDRLRPFSLLTRRVPLIPQATHELWVDSIMRPRYPPQSTPRAYYSTGVRIMATAKEKRRPQTPDEAVDPSVAVVLSLASSLRSIRGSRGWSLEELARRSSVSRGMLLQIEGARTNASVATLSRIAT